MKKLGIVLLSLLVGSQAFADLTGEWVGWGIWSFDGSGVNCNMTLRFTEKPEQLVRHGGYFECNVVGMETYGATWDLINNELLFENTVVGTYDGKDFTLTEVANETTNIHTKMSVNGDIMTYEEKWISNDGTMIYEILGNFKKR